MLLGDGVAIKPGSQADGCFWSDTKEMLKAQSLLHDNVY